MEESVSSLKEKISQSFGVCTEDIRSHSPLALAYLGDGIYELIVRTIVIEKGGNRPEHLHKAVTKYVKAEAQCAIFLALMESGELTEEEEGVMRRGRNAKSFTTAKNASVSSYRKATGFEALCGYLYLKNETDRLLYLVKKGIDLADFAGLYKTEE